MNLGQASQYDPSQSYTVATLLKCYTNTLRTLPPSGAGCDEGKVFLRYPEPLN